MLLCFRPRTGDYFLSLRDVKFFEGEDVVGFRPRTGDYFLSNSKKTAYYNL